MPSPYEGDTYKHSDAQLEAVNPVDGSQGTAEFQQPVQMWKVSRLSVIYTVPGYSQTIAYDVAATDAGMTMDEFFRVPVYAEKAFTVKQPQSYELKTDQPDGPTVEFEIPYYGD